MNRQRILNKVYKNLLTQNKQSVGAVICRYRSDGLRCAAGWLIPDSMYDADMEGRDIQDVLENFEQLKTHLNIESSDDVNFLMYIQQHMHDNYDREVDGTFKAYLIKGTKRVADEYNLKNPAEKQS